VSAREEGDGTRVAEDAHRIADAQLEFTYERLPKPLQKQLEPVFRSPRQSDAIADLVGPGSIYWGDAQTLVPRIASNSIALSVWSPPYFVGKSYESHLTFEEWQALLREVIRLHYAIIRPGGFVVINIDDILCFKDSSIPKIQAEAVEARRSPVTRQDVLDAIARHPGYNRYQLAALLGCSEQTVDRRLNGNNIRGGKYEAQTRIKVVGGLVEDWALAAGFYPYDRRIWVKDPTWENSRWHSLSYRSVDEFEYLYFLWKPGITKFDRSRLTKTEWKDWGSRSVWSFRSVSKNRDHEAKFPSELPKRVIKLLTDPGEIVLDCFVGSGTTAIAAIQQNRQFIGIEIERKYADLAKRHVAAALRLAHVHRPG